MLGVAELEQLPVSQARAGDAGAWDALFRRFQLPLYVYVFELVRDEQTSLDIVQETFINAARHIHSLRSDRKFGSWLFGIAHQKCIQRWRKQAHRTGVPPVSDLDEIADSENVPAPTENAPDELLIRQEEEAEFMNLLNQLPLPQRSVLLLYFMEDFSIEEIAGITGVSVGTVKSRLHYAKKSLRKLVVDTQDPDRSPKHPKEI